MDVISNTTVISNFAAIDRIELLNRRFERLYISEQVFEEIQAGLLQGCSFYAGMEKQIFPFSEKGWLHLTSLNGVHELRTYGKLIGNLHSGEASCLSISHHRNWLFLSDDKAARRKAKELETPISGTLGVMLTLIKDDVITLNEADEVLKKMIHKGYYSPVASLKELLSR